MDSVGANYKFIGYDSATHAFSNPECDGGGTEIQHTDHNAAADTASWNEMKLFFKELFK